MGVRIVLAEREPIGLALKRFKKQLERHGVTIEMRLHVHYVKPTHKRRAKRFQKRYGARRAILIAAYGGKYSTPSAAKALALFRKKSGKP
jgi:small subunit ribosomal protein S21